MKIALVGQPNSGKSTIFNHAAGYKAITSNFPGKTVTYTSKMTFQGVTIEIADLPGTYSLTSFDLAELETRKYLLRENVDVVVNVVDAALLSRELELTLQVLELNLPTILCLNMIDEAEARGIEIDEQKLAQALDIPVVKTVAHKGWGIDELFENVIKMKSNPSKGKIPTLSKDVEDVLKRLVGELEDKNYRDKFNVPLRFLATKLLKMTSTLLKKKKT